MYAKKYDWKVFLPAADEWIVAYSLPPALHTIKLFMIGQAVELYLKSVVTKQEGSVDLALDQKHDIKRLWDLCKKNDTNFMPQYEIRGSVLNAGPKPPSGSRLKHLGVFAPEGFDEFRHLKEADREHFKNNVEIYAVAKLLPHLKYLTIPWETMPESFHIPGWLFRNPYWIAFFKELRLYLGPPLPNHDHIKDTVGWNNLPDESRSFLSGLYD